MEKPIKAPLKSEPRQPVQPPLQDCRKTSTTKAIRRQLGWGLIEIELRGALR